MAFLWKPPLQRHPLFLGRDELLAQLEARFAQQPRLIPVLALTGLTGIGKTQLALAYAARVARQYQRVLWLDASSRETLHQCISPLAADAETRRPASALLPAFRDWLSERVTPWLLVLDHMEDLSLLGELVPWQGPGQILVTTQAQATGAFAQAIRVEALSREDAALFFLRRARIITPKDALSRAPAERQREAWAIADALDGLPLALDQAGASVANTRARLTTTGVLSREQQAMLLSRRGRTLDDSHPASMTETIVQQMKRLTPATRALLHLLAFFPSDALPHSLTLRGMTWEKALRPLAANDLALNEAMAELVGCSLLHRGNDTRVMYGVVQTIVSETLPWEQRHSYAEQAATFMSKAKSR